MAALVENPDPPLADAVLNRATPDPHILAHAIGARESVYRIVWEKKIGPRQAQVFSGSEDGGEEVPDFDMCPCAPR